MTKLKSNDLSMLVKIKENQNYEIIDWLTIIGLKAIFRLIFRVNTLPLSSSYSFILIRKLFLKVLLSATIKLKNIK